MEKIFLWNILRFTHRIDTFSLQFANKRVMLHSSPFSSTYRSSPLQRREWFNKESSLSFSTKNFHKNWDSKSSSTFNNRGSYCICGSHFSQDLSSSLNRMRSHDIARLKPVRLGQRYSQGSLFSREDLVDFYGRYKYCRYSLGSKVPKHSQFNASPFASQSALRRGAWPNTWCVLVGMQTITVYIF